MCYYGILFCVLCLGGDADPSVLPFEVVEHGYEWLTLKSEYCSLWVWFVLQAGVGGITSGKQWKASVGDVQWYTIHTILCHCSLLYEVFPMSFLMEQAGGQAFTGKGRVSAIFFCVAILWWLDCRDCPSFEPVCFELFKAIPELWTNLLLIHSTCKLSGYLALKWKWVSMGITIRSPVYMMTDVEVYITGIIKGE